ncbi:ADP-ribose pyrophosphatase, mitochondrial isoform X2 [Arctopsyche grandis]|uniref:ADP-ribose pyrophosphatase, mitochondrial isoform X2 n=1 Tax=Arctopsyche grandis TaxID=121162 RepID=UPI00406D7B5C
MNVTLSTRIILMAGCHGGVCFGGVYPTSQVRRQNITKDKIPWLEKFPEYSPPYFDSDRLDGKPWADPVIKAGSFKWNVKDSTVDRRSFEGDYTIEDGYPLNPAGRTGLRGRGLLGRWGPNHAADPIVTRWKRDDNKTIVQNPITNKSILQLIVIKRRDNGMWALPGGMVDSGEEVCSAAIREFLEEATNSLQKSHDDNIALKSQLEDFFCTGKEVYRGYVDDPRNTDNAWMETTAFNFHDNTGDTVGDIALTAGDDAVGAKWIDVNKELSLHASHIDFVHKVAEILQSDW